MFWHFKNIVCLESKEVQKVGPQINAVIYGYSIFAISTQEKIRSGQKETYVQVGIGVPT